MYKPTIESLKQYNVPSWFKDCKLGIFLHWGVYSVPACEHIGCWYGKQMYNRKHAAFEYHRQTWGDQTKFGYKDFIPLFKAENWDPDDWAELFKDVGAGYVIPVADFHDAFAMYDSSYTKWNAVNMGPRRDIVGELSRAVRKQGMRFGASSHLVYNWEFFPNTPEFGTHDPVDEGLYGEVHTIQYNGHAEYPDDNLSDRQHDPVSNTFVNHWYNRTVELVDKYELDLLWFDYGTVWSEFRERNKQIAAHFYNRAQEWGKEVVLNMKGDSLPPEIHVLDFERGGVSGIHSFYWQTDTSISYRDWSFINNDIFKSPTKIVHDLIDCVSKGGNLLLNVGPKADGTIPEESRQVLLALRDWLKVNGEAIFETRHWEIHGEGVTTRIEGYHNEKKDDPYTPQDIRFTKKGNILYATCLGWPGSQAIIKTLRTGSSVKAATIRQITMLGSGIPLAFHQNETGLIIQTPAQPDHEHAYVFRIEL